MQLHFDLNEISKIDWGSILPIIIPFFLVTLLLIMIALIDLYRHRATREHVLMWTFFILFFNTIGPILYFAIGRKDVHEHAIRNQ
ncbi:PLD nuclease N-terminal domain-containing protein [Bacillus sp. Cr_A10]|uniref:PLD nuclease N-terminal domain-containing protein n=1 Tax=Bacillus sp. Cr_A10 TaxID=3033993 RepID=UPI0023DAA2A5|nr:PLD nuclease N-terminal domain-containing protein [Bacillus sp. Cr_A10]MDF2065935.1 PLD nuclease N-terminal domain-containing protein [Bacillus sp. Cr_A10]